MRLLTTSWSAHFWNSSGFCFDHNSKQFQWTLSLQQARDTVAVKSENVTWILSSINLFSAQDELTEELEKIDVDNIDLIDQALDEMMEADHTKTKLVFYKNKEAVTESQEIGQPVEVIVT